MLPNADLKPLYDKIVWLWVYRDFQKGPGDLAAERVMNRLGVSSYPHLLFADATTRVIGDSGRTTSDILATAEKASKAMQKPDADLAPLEAKMRKAREKKGDSRTLLEELAAGRDAGEYWVEARDLLAGGRKHTPTDKDLTDPDADRRADALDALPEKPFAKEAPALLRDPDADVRMRAVRYVAKAAPGELSKALADLLGDSMDSVKFAALDALKGAKDAGLSDRLCDAWKRLDEGKITSRNPNVLRGRIASCLGDAGGADSVPLLGEFAAKHEFLNGTTHTCVAALAKIGKRIGAKVVAPSLVRAFPPGVTPADAEKKVDVHCVRLAKGVHDALELLTGEKPVAFPKGWSDAERASTVAAWSKMLGVKP